jgi:hypothetical protein
MIFQVLSFLTLLALVQVIFFSLYYCIVLYFIYFFFFLLLLLPIVVLSQYVHLIGKNVEIP